MLYLHISIVAFSSSRYLLSSNYLSCRTLKVSSIASPILHQSSSLTQDQISMSCLIFLSPQHLRSSRVYRKNILSNLPYGIIHFTYLISSVLFPWMLFRKCYRLWEHHWCIHLRGDLAVPGGPWLSNPPRRPSHWGLWLLLQQSHRGEGHGEGLREDWGPRPLQLHTGPNEWRRTPRASHLSVLHHRQSAPSTSLWCESWSIQQYYWKEKSEETSCLILTSIKHIFVGFAAMFDIL